MGAPLPPEQNTLNSSDHWRYGCESFSYFHGTHRYTLGVATSWIQSLHFLSDCRAWRKTPACREESVSSQILMDLSVFVMFPHCTCYGVDAMLLHQKTTSVTVHLLIQNLQTKRIATANITFGPSSVLFLQHITERQPVFIPRLLRFSYHFMELRLNPTTLQITVWWSVNYLKTSVQGSLWL